MYTTGETHGLCRDFVVEMQPSLAVPVYLNVYQGLRHQFGKHFILELRQSSKDIAVELVLVDCHRVTKDDRLGTLVVSPFDGERWHQTPMNGSIVRGPHGGVGGGEGPTVDRPVAVWHRLAAA